MNSSIERNSENRYSEMRKKLISALIIMAMALSITGITATDSASAAGSSYWLKVNRTANVVNVYKNVNGSWQPYKVMLCSAAKTRAAAEPPPGIFRLRKSGAGRGFFMVFPDSMSASSKAITCSIRLFTKNIRRAAAA